jgi:ribosomal protein S8
MFFNTINLIKNNYHLKKKKLKIKLNLKEKQILKIFLQLNVIKLIKNNKNTYNIYFNYIDNEPIFRNIKNIYKPSKPVFINLKQILKINKKNNFIFYISTNKGVITNFEAEKYKIGGILILKIKI